MALGKKWTWSAIAILAATFCVLLAMDRPLISASGDIYFWHGVVQSSENSQHISDWYTPSHIIHGFIFYALGYLLLRKYPKGLWLCVALLLECGWEIAENTPAVIDRYRSVTMAFGYSGDSILNSVCDALWMVAGFWFASRAPMLLTAGIAVIFELFTLYMIRDNLTLNILMLLWPIDAIKQWQGAI